MQGRRALALAQPTHMPASHTCHSSHSSAVSSGKARHRRGRHVLLRLVLWLLQPLYLRHASCGPPAAAQQVVVASRLS